MQVPFTSEYNQASVQHFAQKPNMSQVNLAETKVTPASVFQQSKKMQDLAVLNASATVNLNASKSAANNPMSLLYKTAIEEINQQLAPTLGENAAQSAYESNLDVSPEATAERILEGSTAFYDAFKSQNSDLSEEEALSEFIKVISSGIDQGFEDAKNILDSLSVLEGDIASNIDETYSLVQTGLAEFKEQIMASFTQAPTPDENLSEVNKATVN